MKQINKDRCNDFVKKEKNEGKLQYVSFQKSQKLLADFRTFNSYKKAGYVTTAPDYVNGT